MDNARTSSEICPRSDSIAAAISSVAFHVTLMRSEISSPSLLRRSWINLITSRTLPAAMRAGFSSKSSATLSPSWEETLQPLFGTSVTTKSSRVISQVPTVVIPTERKVFTSKVASVAAIALAIS